MNLLEVKEYLKENFKKENTKFYGVSNNCFIDQVTNNWFNDTENYDGRWAVITNRVESVGKVLDMAAGCGTFVLNGLQNGYDVYGVEPEDWKREYYLKKIMASNYPSQWNNRIHSAVGEALPFEDESFDLITSYQTLEHVCDVTSCLREMLRVLKCGGVMYIRAPDYNSFYEPHYGVPFLPKMNKKLAEKYLKLIKRPLLGLGTLTWTTEKDIFKILNEQSHDLIIKRASQFYSERRIGKIRDLLPNPLKKQLLVRCLNKAYETKLQVFDAFWIGRRERNIDLWITKIR